MMTSTRGHSRVARRAALSILACSVALAAGCGFDIPQDEAPTPKVRSVFDPATGTIPLPNTAALEADGTLPNLGDGSDTAQANFYNLLDESEGWLTSTPIEIPYNGALDEGTVNAENVILVEISDEDGSLTQLPLLNEEVEELEEGMMGPVVYEELDGEGPARSRIIVNPAEPLQPDTAYGVIATNAILGDNGEPTLPSTAVFFALNEGPLIDENGEITVPQLRPAATDSPAETEAQLELVRGIEGIRQTLAPIVDGLGQFELSREDIVVAASWRTTRSSFTSFNADTGEIPLPSTVALDEEDGTFPTAGLPALVAYNAAEAAGENPPLTAQVYFDQYLDRLHGWPNTAESVPIQVPLINPIDEATLGPDTIQLWRIGEDRMSAERITDVTLAYDDGEDGNGPYLITVTPAEDLELDTDYFAFATRDIRGANGDEILPAAELFLGIQPAEIADGDDNSLVEQVSQDDLPALQGLRAVYRPVVELIEAEAGIEYDELASVATWYSWRDPFIVFDPIAGDIPFPNTFLIGEDGTANLPIPEGANPILEDLYQEVNTRDGFSVLGQGWVTVLGELDPASVTFYEGGSGDERGAIAMAAVPPGEGLMIPTTLTPEEMAIEYVPEYNRILFRPQLPLRKGFLHAAILSDRLVGTNGFKAQPTPIFVMLASPARIADDEGNSLIAQLPQSAAADLEAGRQQYARLFQAAGFVTDDDRNSVTGAFAFTPDNVTEPMQQLRAQVINQLGGRAALAAERACDGDATRDCNEDLLDNTDGSFDSYDGPRSAGRTWDLSNVAQVQWAAEFDNVRVIDEMSQQVGYDAFTTERVPFTLFVPKTVPGQCEPPFDVVITQHGLSGSRKFTGLGLASALAAPEYCLASIAPDALLHGGRADAAMTLHPEGLVGSSGDGFLSVNFNTAKNHFQQGVLDLVTLNQIVRAGGLEGLVADSDADPMTPMFNTENTAVVGVSLGGIFATVLTAIDPDINVTALNVAPGKLTYYLTEDSLIGDNIVPLLSLVGIEPGTFAFEQAISIAQWIADVVDPAAFAVHLVDDELDVLVYDAVMDAFPEQMDPDVVPQAEVLVQMAEGDGVAPNVSTEQLAEVLEFDLAPTTFDAGHGFIVEQDSTSDDFAAAQCGREQIAFFIRAALDGDDTELPSNLEASTCVANTMN